MNNRFPRLSLRSAMAVVMALVSIMTASSAVAKLDGYRGANWPEAGSNPAFLYGKPFNTFNRYIDNGALCFGLGFADKSDGSDCTNDLYADEREFVSVYKVGRALSDGTVAATPAPTNGKGMAKKFHDYTGNDLQEGDVLRAYVFVHNNASTINNDSRYEARDVRAMLTTSGNRIIGTIKAKNTFESDPSAADLAAFNAGQLLNREATFTDDATVQLPSGLGLEIYSRSTNVINGRVDYCILQSDKTCTTGKIGDPIQLSDGRFSFSGNVLTYMHGKMVGSKPNSLYLVVDLKVVKSNNNGNQNNGNQNGGDNNNRERPDTYQECVDGTTIVRFTWDEARSGDTLSVYKTPSGSTTEELYVYTVNSTYGTVRHTNLRNSSGQALSLRAGDKVRWRVGSGDRMSRWFEATIQDCANLNDGLRMDLARMAPCARPLFNPYFVWNTPGRTKRLDVSTSSTFTEYWTKDISNVTNTSGPEGFVFMDQRNKALEFRGNVTYYWRIREEGKIYPGPQFSVPLCPPVDCEVLYGKDSPNCKDGKIVDMKECKPGVCACVEVAVNPASAGDFNTVTFTTKVSNQSKDTVSRRIEIQHLRPDGKKGYTLTAILPGNQYVEFDATCTSATTPLGGKCDTKEQGDFEITGIKVTQHPGANRNTTYSDAASNPIQIEQLEDFLRDRSKPILVRNLYPDDYVNIEVTGVARTSKAGKEFAEGTDKVNYNFFMKSQSNNGVQKLVIARPFLLTVNDGDVITSAILKGFSNLEAVYKNTFGVDFRAISGFSYNSSTNPNVQSQVNQQNLGFGNNLRGLTIISDTPKTAGSELSITSESDFSKLNIRPDQTRIFSTKNQKLTFGSLAGGKVELANSSTIYIKDADVTINSDIVYKTGTNAPSFALVVENGKIFIHPSVKQLDGVYVVLGNSSTSRISGTPNWKNYYETSKQQPQVLAVNGALYGNIDDLIPSRPNAAISGSSFDAIKKSAGIAINFDGRIYSFPPPGLQEIIGGVYDLLRNTK